MGCKIIRLAKMDANEKKATLEFLRKEILNGKIVVCGTDTLYGISGNALDVNVVKRIYEIKHRDPRKPLSICFSNKEEIHKYVYVNEVAERIIKAFLPGPLTVVLKKKSGIPDIVAKEYVGVRIPDAEVIRQLAVVPITTTSANISGKASPTSFEELDKAILEKVDYAIDTGRCRYAGPSTVIKITDSEVTLLREGVLPFSKILKLISSGA